MTEKILVKPRAAAQLLDISIATLYRFVKNNEIPHIRLRENGDNRHLRFSVEALEEWVEGKQK